MSVYKPDRIYKQGERVARQLSDDSWQLGTITTAVCIRGVWRWRITWDGAGAEDAATYVAGQVAIKHLNAYVAEYRRQQAGQTERERG